MQALRGHTQLLRYPQGTRPPTFGRGDQAARPLPPLKRQGSYGCSCTLLHRRRKRLQRSLQREELPNATEQERAALLNTRPRGFLRRGVLPGERSLALGDHAADVLGEIGRGL